MLQRLVVEKGKTRGPRGLNYMCGAHDAWRMGFMEFRVKGMKGLG